MHHKSLIEQVRARPALFGLDGTYALSIAFLTGVDIGASGGLLRGFNEWLVVRSGKPSSLGWQYGARDPSLAGAQ